MQNITPTNANTWILRAPKVENYSTGNLSIPMSALQNSSVKFFYYHGPIPEENRTVEVIMPKKMVHDGCIYRNPHKGNIYQTTQCNNASTEFMLLPFWQISQYLRTGKMTVMQTPEKNERITAEKKGKAPKAKSKTKAKTSNPVVVQKPLF